MAEGKDEGGLDPRFRWALALVGLGLLVAGCVATFVTTNDVGAASLIAGGFAFAALAYLGDRITRLKYGQFEADIAVKRAEALIGAASVAEAAGEPERAENLRAEAVKTLDQLRVAGQGYEGLRRSMPAGWERTRLMEKQVAEARSLAKEKGIDADQVRQLVASGTEGDRIEALGAMEALPEARDFDLVLALVTNPKTPFEHYHALRVAKDMVPGLDERQKQRLADVVSRQRTERRLAKDSDRRILIEGILQATGAKE